MPGVAGGDGDLLGAVGVAVEAGLGDEQPRRTAGHRLDPLGDDRSPRRRAADGAGRRRSAPRYSPNTSRITAPHSPVVPPARARAIVAGITLSPPSATRRSSSSAASTAACVRAARHCSTSATISASTAGSTRRIAPSPPSGDGCGLGEAVDADHDLLAGLDAARALGHRRHQPRLQLVDGLERAAQRQHVVELGLGRVAQLGRRCLDDVRAVEQVAVLEQVGLVREHLLHPQRPLLVPRRGQAERLVPRRQLDAARPGPLRQRDAEHLEHDALHVVLRLRLGQAEGVDLHAVAEPAGLRVRRRRSARARCGPTAR